MTASPTIYLLQKDSSLERTTESFFTTADFIPYRGVGSAALEHLPLRSGRIRIHQSQDGVDPFLWSAVGCNKLCIIYE